MNEFEHEPIPGLPAHLPAGERLLWQGSPDWWSVARRVLHVRAITLYFGVLLLWRAASGWYDGQTAQQILSSCAWLLVLGIATLLFLLWVAHRVARSTIYSISSKRVVMRYGVALPVALNIPFAAVRNAALREYADGTGDIPLELATQQARVAYLHLWPHARPWKLTPAQPMLRGVPQASQAARILAEALAP